MKLKFKFPLLLLLFSLMGGSALLGQSKVGTIGLGLDVGGQVLYGDQQNDGIGLGLEGLLSVRVLKFAEIAGALGYSQLRYDILGVTNTTNMINVDLRGNFELVSSGLVRPFVSLGVGVVSFEVGNSGAGRKLERMYFGGGGLKFQLNPKVNWFVNAGYHFTDGDNLDSPLLTAQGTSNDGWLNLRTGISYSPNSRDDRESQVIAMQNLPFDQIDPNEVSSFDRQDDFQRTPQLGAKDMEEYVKLKSRVDALGQKLDSQDSEIIRLQGSLDSRKNRLVSLEKTAERSPTKPLRKNTSMSGFDEIYREALTNYYNKSYGESVSLFRMLLQQYPGHNLSGNCRYWIGSNLFLMDRYQESIEELKLVLSSEQSYKSDDTLFLLGRAYLKIGSGDSARESFFAFGQ